MPCKKNCVCKSCVPLLRGLPGFPAVSAGGGGGGDGVLANRQLQVAQSYSPGTPLTNYQFTSLQTAINYANSLSPTASTPISILIYPGTYNGVFTLYDNIHLTGFGDGSLVFLNGTLTYNNVAPNSITGIADLTVIGATTLTLNTPSTFLSTKILFSGQTTYSTVASAEFIIDNCWFSNTVNFGPMVAQATANEKTVAVSNSIFTGAVNVGTDAGAGNVVVVNVIGSTFDESCIVAVGNGTSASILRANSCTFIVHGTLALPTGAKVTVATNAFANLMGSPIPSTAVTGSGTADMDLIVNTSMSVSDVGANVLFSSAYGASGFGTITNTSATGYVVTVTPVTNTPVAISIDSPSATGVTLYSETGTVNAQVAIHRAMSPI